MTHSFGNNHANLKPASPHRNPEPANGCAAYFVFTTEPMYKTRLCANLGRAGVGPHLSVTPSTPTSSLSCLSDLHLEAVE